MTENGSISFDGGTTINGGTGPIAVGVKAETLIQISNYQENRHAVFWSEQGVRELIACYVKPPNHDQVVKVLRDDRAVIVTGRRDTGRTVAAVAAMRELDPSLGIVGFDLETEIGITGDGLVGRPYGFLHRVEPGQARARELVERWRRSEPPAGSLLAIIADEADAQDFQLAWADAEELRAVKIDIPDPVEVYHRRLQVRGLADTCWWDWPRAHEMLNGQPPGTARRLAGIVERLQRDGGDGEHQREQAEQAFLG